MFINHFGIIISNNCICLTCELPSMVSWMLICRSYLYLQSCSVVCWMWTCGILASWLLYRGLKLWLICTQSWTEALEHARDYRYCVRALSELLWWLVLFSRTQCWSLFITQDLWHNDLLFYKGIHTHRNDFNGMTMHSAFAAFSVFNVHCFHVKISRLYTVFGLNWGFV